MIMTLILFWAPIALSAACVLSYLYTVECKP